MKKKLAYMLSILLFGVFLATGCGSQTASAGSSNVKILLSVNAMDDFRQTLVDLSLIHI